jgi:hypothetical protein
MDKKNNISLIKLEIYFLNNIRQIIIQKELKKP